MQYRQFGNTGLVLSRMAFGAMTFGQGTLVGDLVNDVDQKLADRMVGVCLDAGINFFDTADMYTSGQSEIMLGKALKEKRHDAVIATKCGFRSSEAMIARGLSRRYILAAVEGSLQRLDTDYIDLFLLHIPDPVTPLEETARALDDLVRKGCVRYVGFCNYPAWKAQKLIGIQERLNLTPVAAAQMYYSLLGRDIEHEVVPFIQENRLGLMVWSPLASGFLTGKYTLEGPSPKEGRRLKFDFPPVDRNKGDVVVQALGEIAAKYAATAAQVALAWVLSKSFVSSVIIGARSIHQLDDNLKAGDLRVQEADLQALDALTAPTVPYPAWMQEMAWDEALKAALGR
jgi:aryl-alcohol dehydrogenase-like predicted oxidoreductase